MANSEQPSRPAFVRDVFALAGSSALGALLVIAVSPLLSRLYSPVDYTAYAALVSLTTILGAVASLRLELALPLPKDEKTAANLAAAGLISTLLISHLAALSVYFGLEPWLSMLNWLFPNSASVTQACATARYIISPHADWVLLGVFSIGCLQLGQYATIRREDHSSLVRARIGQGAAQAVAQSALGLLRFGGAGLYAGESLARLLGAVWLCVKRWREWNRLEISNSNMWAALREYWRYPVFATWAGVLSALSHEWPMLWVAANFPAEQAGAFAFTQRLVWAPLTMLGMAAGQAYQGRLAALRREQPAEALPFFLRLARTLALAGILPAVALHFFGQSLFVWIFGPAWSHAGALAADLVPLYWAHAVITPLFFTLSVLKRPGWLLLWEVLRWSGLLWAGLHAGADFEGFLRGYLSVQLAAYLLLLLGSWRALSART